METQERLRNNQIYLRAYGLKERPYSTNPDERFLYLTDNHTDALEMAIDVIEDKEGVMLIHGDKGSGKTTILRRLKSQMEALPNTYHVAFVEAPDQSPTEFQFVKEVVEAFGKDCIANNRKARFDIFKELLFDDFKKGVTAVLLVDEAHRMPSKVLESIRGYLNFEDNISKYIQIVLFAQPPIMKTLKRVDSLRNRLEHCQLNPMSRREMDEMLFWRFSQAGGKKDEYPFDEACLKTIFRLTQGLPRSTVGLAKLTLRKAGKDARKERMRNNSNSPITAKDIAVTPKLIKQQSKHLFVGKHL